MECDFDGENFWQNGKLLKKHNQASLEVLWFIDLATLLVMSLFVGTADAKLLFLLLMFINVHFPF